MRRYYLLLLFAVLLHSCAKRVTETGKASYYAQSLRGKPTASGAPYHPGRRTAAHRTLPFGTKVRVKNMETGRSVTVRINDRGPFVAGRIIDLSRKAARKTGLLKSGVATVQLRYKRPKRSKA